MKYKKKNLISILITNYNKEKFLNKSLQSCLKQNFRDKEIILFDDCSNDKSLEIFKKYPSIKLIKNKKKKYLSGPQNQIYGLSTILQKSKGDIIFLLDSDDEFKLNKLATIFQKFKNDQNLKFIQDTPILTSSKKKMKLKNKIRRQEGKCELTLYLKISKKVHFPNRNSLGPQNIVRSRRMKIEIGNRKRE